MLDMDIIYHVVAAIGQESVLTNLTRVRSARPPSLSAAALGPESVLT